MTGDRLASRELRLAKLIVSIGCKNLLGKRGWFFRVLDRKTALSVITPCERLVAPACAGGRLGVQVALMPKKIWVPMALMPINHGWRTSVSESRG